VSAGDAIFAYSKIALSLPGCQSRQPMPKPLHTSQYGLFLEELRAARGRSGMTQGQLADAIGEDQTFVSKCETGVRRLDVIELRRWLVALGVGLAPFLKALEGRLDGNRLPSPLSPGRGSRAK
jgi:hypothetical protein